LTFHNAQPRISVPARNAKVAELVDAQVSEACGH